MKIKHGLDCRPCLLQQTHGIHPRSAGYAALAEGLSPHILASVAGLPDRGRRSEPVTVFAGAQTDHAAGANINLTCDQQDGLAAGPTISQWGAFLR